HSSAKTGGNEGHLAAPARQSEGFSPSAPVGRRFLLQAAELSGSGSLLRRRRRRLARHRKIGVPEEGYRRVSRGGKRSPGILDGGPDCEGAPPGPGCPAR